MIPGFFPITKGGAEMFALNLCSLVQKKGIFIHLLTRNLNLARKDEFLGIQINRFSNILPYKVKYYGFGEFLKSKYVRILVAVFDLFGVLPFFWQLHRKYRFNVIHASFILPFGLAGLIIKKLLKIPLVITVHGPADFYEVPRIFSPVLRFVLKRADAVVAVSPKLKNDLVSKLGDLSINLIYNGIPLNRYKGAGDPIKLEQYGISSKDFVILTASRLVQRKNLDLLIKAVPKLRDLIPNCKIVILGSGIEEKKLNKLIEDLDLTPNILLLGWVSETNKIEFFKRANVFIQLSQIEGLSLALLESKAAGTPAIITESKGTSGVVVPEKSGLIIKAPVTSEKIIERIYQLYSNVGLREKISKYVRTEAVELYSLDEMVRKYIEVYREIKL